MPVTLLMFLFSGRVGALSSRYGPRLFMGSGPLVAAAGTLLLTRLDVNVDYLTDVLPAMLLFGAGLTLTVAPLTATVMSDARRGDSGIASGVNNAVARVAGMLGIAVVGVADERLGEEVKAFVVLKPGFDLSAEDFTGWCREQFAANKYPRLVEFRDSLPISATGKILKRELRQN